MPNTHMPNTHIPKTHILYTHIPYTYTPNTYTPNAYTPNLYTGVGIVKVGYKYRCTIRFDRCTYPLSIDEYAGKPLQCD